MQEIESTCAIGANDVQFSNICVSQANGRACYMLVDARLGSPDISYVSCCTERSAVFALEALQAENLP
jgi:hypothetical protein